MALDQLIGEFPHTMDAKGRVKLPAAWTDELQQRFIVTRGTGKMLFLFSLDQWELFKKKLEAIPMFDRQGQEVRRRLGASASPCEVDKQGRFLIPQRLRDHAGLTRDVVLAGAFTYGEIWDATRWEQHNAAFDSDDEAEGEIDPFLALMDEVSAKYTV